MTDEEYVRANWELWHRCDGSYRDYPKDTILLQRTNGRWNDFHTWAAAAEFTRERLEQIRLIEEERAMLCGKVLLEDRDMAIMKRVLARLESALADLKRNMI